MQWYILKGKRVFKATREEYFSYMRKCDLGISTRQVGLTTVIPGVCVSTVFLMIDHSFERHRPKKVHIPVVFETMVFGGPDDQYRDRYCTWTQAELGHKRIVEMVTSHIKELNPN